MSNQYSSNHQIKDSVFTDLFSIPENQMDLYRNLHPEDHTATISDISNVTLDPTLMTDIYNDLGFQVRNQLMILLESQATFSENILVRAFLYLAKTYQDFFHKKRKDLFKEKPVHCPKPELYMVYVGQETTKSKETNVFKLSDVYFNGEVADLEVQVHIIKNPEPNSVLGQYVQFCQILNEERKIHGETITTVKNTIQICKEKNILVNYLTQREKEVVRMYSIIYDKKFIAEAHDADLKREYFAKGKAEEKIEIASKLISMGNMTNAQIAEMTGLSLEKINELRQNASC